MKIYPSLISSDLLNLENTVHLLDDHCDGYHIDVMDFHFVPNLTWGPQFIKALAQITKKPLHVHLMVDNPRGWLDVLHLRSGDSILFHAEAVKSADELLFLIKHIKKRDYFAGLALNPSTPIDASFAYLQFLDEVLLMSVEPGFSGQAFISSVADKIKPLKQRIAKENTTCAIGMDGGVTKENSAELAQQGVDSFCIASAIFSHSDPVQAIKDLHAAIK